MKEKNLTLNFIYNSFYQILVLLIPLITTPYLSRVVGKEPIGRFSYIHAFASYFVLFAMLGVNNYGNRSIAQCRDNNNELSKTFFSIYALQVVTSVISITAYCIFVFFICHDRTMGVLMLPYVVSAGVDINWFFFGLEKFKLTVTRNTMIKLLTVASILLFVKKPEDINKYSLIYVVGTLLSQLLLWPFVFKYVKIQMVTKNDVLRHLKPNLVLFIPIIAVSIYKIMDKIMLGYISNNIEVGLYENSDKVIQVPIALVNSLGTVMMPKISNLVSKNNVKQSNSYFEKSILVVAFLSSSLGFGIMSISKEFVPLFYGPGYEQCITLFQLLLPSSIFVAYANVVRTQYLIPNGRDKVYIITVFSGAIINLVFNTILIPKFASTGAAIATLGAEITVCVLQIFLIRKEFNVMPYIAKSVRFVIAGLIMYIINISLVFDWKNSVASLGVKIIIGAVVYSVMILPFYLFSKKKKKTYT